MLTPVGEMSKQETRALARKLGLATADKPESVEICFVPDDDYAAVLEQHLPADAPALAPGPFVTSTGEVLGQHAGFARYTVGQRKGLPGGRSLPLYVLAIRPDDRAVVVGGAEELGSRAVRLEELNWLAAPLDIGDRCEVQIRYRAPSVPATITALDDGGLALVSDSPMRAVTPGQSGVLYSAQGQVLGGGVIS
jgi:tRNA-specific 2-thiouridylase